MFKDDPLTVENIIDALLEQQAGLDPENPEEDITLGVYEGGTWELGSEFALSGVPFDDTASSTLNYTDDGAMLKIIAVELLRDLERGRAFFEELSRDD